MSYIKSTQSLYISKKQWSKIIVLYFIAGLFVGLLLQILGKFNLLHFYNVFFFLYVLLMSFLIIYLLIGINLLIQNILSHIFKKREITDIDKYSPQYSFSAIVPAYQVSENIVQTLYALDAITYPNTKKEIVVITKYNDFRTNREVEIVRQSLPESNIYIYSYYDSPDTKEHAINYGIYYAKNDIVAIFEAGDIPNSSLYAIANATLQMKEIAVLQSGISSEYNPFGLKSIMKLFTYFFRNVINIPLLVESNILLLEETLTFYRRSVLLKLNGLNEYAENPFFDLKKKIILQKIPSFVSTDKNFFTTKMPHNEKNVFKTENNNIMKFLLSGEWLFVEGNIYRFTLLYTFILPFILLVLILFSSMTFLAAQYGLFLMILAAASIFMAILSLLYLLLTFVIIFTHHINTNIFYQLFYIVFFFLLFIPFTIFYLITTFISLIRNSKYYFRSQTRAYNTLLNKRTFANSY